jgi:flagellar biosynthesis protein FliP
MNEMINKPMSVIRQEFTEQLVSDINNCKLPLFVVEYILQDVLDTVKSAAKQQCEMEKIQYEELLKKSQEDIDKE